MRLSFPNRSGVEWNARFRESKIFELANLILELKFWLFHGASILRQAHLGASRDHDLDDIPKFFRYYFVFRDEFMMRSDRPETLNDL